MKKQLHSPILLFLFVGILAFSSCNSNVVYENYNDFQNNEWYADSVVRFRFEILNPSKPHHLYYNIRHSLAYPYYNLYVQYSLHSEKEQPKWQRKDSNLMNPTTGVPFGQGTSDLYNCRFDLLENYNFEKKGTYVLEIKQDMRLDTLPEISAIGFRVELAE